ncbi:integrase, catalytic region, zinc finger, CCHC-type containing protein [Tanacetum coccineum]
MSTLAKYMIVTGADNRPPMLDKPQYESWKSRMEFYIQGKDHGQMILNSVEKEKLHNTCDLKAVNIVLQGLPPDVYALMYSPPPQSNPYGVHFHQKQYSPQSQSTFNHSQPSVTQSAYPQMTLPQQSQAEFLQMESGLSVPTFLQGNDPIACLNKVIITVQQVQGRQGQNVAGSRFQGNSSRSRGNSTGQAKTVKCYNYQGMGHMARQCTMPKRKRDAAWFKEKGLLVQSQVEGKMLDEEELAFLADLGIADGSADQTFIHNAVFQTDDLDAYDSDCDDIPFVAAVLMTNLSSCEPETVSEVQYSDYAQNDMFTQSVHKLQYSEQSPNVVYPDVELTSDSNVIPYSQYLQETQQASVPNTDTSAQQNSLIMSIFEQISSHATSWDSTNKENKLVNESLTAELDRYRERVKILEQRINVDLSTREKFIDLQMDDMIRNRNTKFVAFETEIDTLKQKL